MKRYLGLICAVIALVGAVLAGWVDFNNDEPQATVLMILLVTFPLGILLPAKAWLWAVIVALGLPSIYLLAHSLGYLPASFPSPVWYASLLSIIPALLGAYAGAFGRAIINRVRV